MFIDHIFFMDEILKLEKEASKYTKTVNLSTWNSSKEYENEIFKRLTPFNLVNSTKYTYSYDIPLETRNRCVKKIIGTNNEDEMCLFLGNATLAILNILNFLKQYGCNHILIIGPSYFSVFEVCKTLGISYEVYTLTRVNNSYVINSKSIYSKQFDAVFITSPIYSTSVPLSDDIIDIINTLTNRKTFVVLDESICINGYETIRSVNINPYLIGIYSPHKSLFCNNNKFSMIICNKKHDDFLEQWIDVLNGSLSYSNQQAIYHFLSDNYNVCNSFALEYFNNNKERIISLIDSYDNCYYDKSIIGPYMTIYLTSVNIKKVYSIDFQRILIKHTGTSFYPGMLNGLLLDNFANFRINLSLATKDLIYHLKQVLDFIYLDQY